MKPYPLFHKISGSDGWDEHQPAARGVMRWTNPTKASAATRRGSPGWAMPRLCHGDIQWWHGSFALSFAFSFPRLVLTVMSHTLVKAKHQQRKHYGYVANTVHVEFPFLVEATWKITKIHYERSRPPIIEIGTSSRSLDVFSKNNNASSMEHHGATFRCFEPGTSMSSTTLRRLGTGKWKPCEAVHVKVNWPFGLLAWVGWGTNPWRSSDKKYKMSTENAQWQVEMLRSMWSMWSMWHLPDTLTEPIYANLTREAISKELYDWLLQEKYGDPKQQTHSEPCDSWFFLWVFIVCFYWSFHWETWFLLELL